MYTVLHKNDEGRMVLSHLFQSISCTRIHRIAPQVDLLQALVLAYGICRQSVRMCFHRSVMRSVFALGVRAHVLKYVSSVHMYKKNCVWQLIISQGINS